jgi:hypothetical protein
VLDAQVKMTIFLNENLSMRFKRSTNFMALMLTSALAAAKEDSQTNEMIVDKP